MKRSNAHFHKVILCVLIFLPLALGTPDFSLASDISLSYESDRLTVDVSNAPLYEVLEKLSAEYGMIVLVDQTIQEKPITVKFTNIPIEKAVKRLAHPYSSATIFSKRLNPAGKEEFYISELKVFESDTGKAAQYVEVSSSIPGGGPTYGGTGESTSPLRVPPTVPGVYGENTYAAKAQKGVQSHLVASQIKKIDYLRSKATMEEVKLKREISQIKMSISDTENNAGRRDLLSKLSGKSQELYKLQRRNRGRIHSEERLLRQLQMR